MGGPRIALSPIALPTVVGNWTAAFSGLAISSQVQIALEKGATSSTVVALFACNDGTIAAGGPIAGTFDASKPSTWPNTGAGAGVGLRYLGTIRGGTPSLPITTDGNTICYVQDANLSVWEPCYLALRLAGTSAQNLDVSGVGDPTGTGGTAWLVGGQAVVDDPGILGPNNGGSLSLQAGAALPVLLSNGQTTLLYANTNQIVLQADGAATNLISNNNLFLSSDGTLTQIGGNAGAESTVISTGTNGFAVSATMGGKITLTPGATGYVDLPPVNSGAGNTCELHFRELGANGINYTGFKAPDALGPTNVIYVLPTADGSSGQVLSTNGSATLAWASGIILGGTNALTLTSGTSGAATLDSGSTGAVNVGTGASAKTTTVGSITSTASILCLSGTGAADFAANATDHTTRAGSTTGVSATAIRAGTGALTLVRNGVTWTWPSTDGVAGAVGGGNVLNSNGAGALSFTQFQSGTATLTSGTVTITANITASSRIVFSLKGNPAALTTQIVAPTRNTGAPGSFVVNGLVAALTVNGADNTTTFDWIIIG